MIDSLKEEAKQLKSENSKLREEVKETKSENSKLREEVKETKRFWEIREENRFEMIKDLFSKVLAACIGSVSI